MNTDIGKPVWIEKEGRWRLSVMRDGKRKQFSCATPGRKGRAQCAQKAREWIQTGSPDRDPTVQALYDEWLDETLSTISYESYRTRASIGRTHILPAIGPMHIGAIRNDQQLQKLINDAYNEGNGGKGLARKTLENIRVTLQSFFAYSRKCGVTTYHPEHLVIPRKAVSGTKTILQPKDLQVLFASQETKPRRSTVGFPRHEWYIHAFRFEVLTGLRPGELLGLRWSDIREDVLHVQRAINNRDALTPGKNANARRSFIIPDAAKRVLRDQRAMLDANGTKSEYIFCDRDGSPSRGRNLGRHLRSYCEHNGISVVTPYELRHTFVSMMKTAPEQLVKQMAGHSQSMDTFGVYGHPVSGDQERMAQMIDDTVGALLKPERE